MFKINIIGIKELSESSCTLYYVHIHSTKLKMIGLKINHVRIHFFNNRKKTSSTDYLILFIIFKINNLIHSKERINNTIVKK